MCFTAYFSNSELKLISSVLDFRQINGLCCIKYHAYRKTGHFVQLRVVNRELKVENRELKGGTFCNKKWRTERGFASPFSIFNSIYLMVLVLVLFIHPNEVFFADGRFLCLHLRLGPFKYFLRLHAVVCILHIFPVLHHAVYII